MQPLEIAARPLLRILNRNIAEITPARELCAQLAGKTIAIRAKNTALSAYFGFEQDLVLLSEDTPEEPDVLLSGSLISLTRMAGPNREALFRDGSVEISGDADTAQQFQRLLELAAPDGEEELSRVVGDIAAHQMSAFARRAKNWSKAAIDTLSTNVVEYVQEESREAPTRYEVERFQRTLGQLRDDVARAEARLNRLIDAN